MFFAVAQWIRTKPWRVAKIRHGVYWHSRADFSPTGFLDKKTGILDN
jgi:hypothetical protein